VELFLGIGKIVVFSGDLKVVLSVF